MKSWLIILIGLISTWHYLDIDSDNGFDGLFLPFLFFSFTLAAVIKLALKLGPADHNNGDSGGGFGGYDGGGSGGGGDC